MANDPRAEMLAQLFAQAIRARSAQATPPPPQPDASATIQHNAELRQAMLQLQQQLSEAANWDAHTATHHFKLAVTDYTAILLLPKLLPTLVQETPNITFDIVPLSPNDLKQSLQDGLYDLAITPHNWVPMRQPGFATQPLFEDRFVAAAREQHPLAQRVTELKVRDVTQTHPRIVDLEGLDALPSELQDGALNVRAFVETVAPQLRRQNTLAILPERMFHAINRHNDLVSMSLPFDMPTVSVWLVFTDEQRTQPPHLWLRMRIRQALIEHGH